MPSYDFECSNGHLEELTCSYSDIKKQRCPVCGAKVKALFPCPGTTGMTRVKGHRGYHSVSLSAGVHKSQVKEMKQMFPHHEYLEDGRMAFRSPAHQQRCLRDIGMFNRDSNLSPKNK